MKSYALPFGIPTPRILGVVFCLLAPFLAISCDKRSTPDWDTPGQAAPATAVEPARPSAPQTPSPAAPVSSDSTAAESPPRASAKTTASATTGGLRFISYNVRNWLTMDRFEKGKTLKGSPKPDSEKLAVVRILARHQPDVLGLCEIGTAADLEEIREALKAAGLDLPNSHYVGGSDPTRHLGLLSRFPITSTAKPAESEYRLAGQTFAINRGILDATIDARGTPYRFVGVHLKSKRDSEQGDQEAIRLNEARLLRRHVDAILKENEAAPLVVYGDFNDTRSTPSLKLIFGKSQSPDHLNPILLKDSHDETWTQYWSLNDLYSRFDFIMVSQALQGQVDTGASAIIDDPEWGEASDHRPVMATFR
jgi:endonuclease/exonuclease/phosphatase family metal-dependent hydrolase